MRWVKYGRTAHHNHSASNAKKRYKQHLLLNVCTALDNVVAPRNNNHSQPKETLHLVQYEAEKEKDDHRKYTQQETTKREIRETKKRKETRDIARRSRE